MVNKLDKKKLGIELFMWFTHGLEGVSFAEAVNRDYGNRKAWESVAELVTTHFNQTKDIAGWE